MARSSGARELRRRALALPWFDGADIASDPRGKAIDAMRKRLGAADADREAILARTLESLDARSGAELLLVLAEDPDPRIRLATCTAGLRMLDPELASSFLHFLTDPDERVRGKAKEVLELTSFADEQRRRFARSARE